MRRMVNEIWNWNKEFAKCIREIASNKVKIKEGRSLKGTIWININQGLNWNDLRSMKCMYNKILNNQQKLHGSKDKLS